MRTMGMRNRASGRSRKEQVKSTNGEGGNTSQAVSSLLLKVQVKEQQFFFLFFCPFPFPFSSLSSSAGILVL